MGRKLLTSAAIAAATFGVAAGPALANSAGLASFKGHRSMGATMSNGLKLTRAQHRLVNSRVQSVEQGAKPDFTGPGGTAVVLNHGQQAECTVPEGGGNYTNFFTKDTTNYIDLYNSTNHTALLVGSCTADLTKPQTSATSSDEPGGKKMIPFPGTYATYSEGCDITFQGQVFMGKAESIVYPDGEFSETCIVPVTAS